MTNMIDRTSHTHPGPPMITTTSTTSYNTVSNVFSQRLSENTETTEHKTLNNALVTANEVYNITWKSSQDHTPSH